jgi:RHS repeat-associated protein
VPRASACTVEEERVDEGFDHLLSHITFSPFAVVPLWNSRGESDDGYFADTGLRTRCAPGDSSRCVRIGWISQWRLLGHADLDPLFWHGTLLQDKRTETRTFYRRNRYYEPATGQFTQEDPIGLSGGMNLYGFANGDPVNFSDPFGLCPVCIAYGIFEIGASIYDATDLAVTGIKYLRGKASGAELSITAASAAAGVVGFGGGYGAGARAVIREGASDIRLWKKLASQELLGEARAGKGIAIAGQETARDARSMTSRASPVSTAVMLRMGPK